MNPTILYQLPPNSHCQMMSYVLQTAEGRLVVIDGGCRPDGEALLRFLEKLGGPRPTVAAWFLTHAHDDHIGALTDLQPAAAGVDPGGGKRRRPCQPGARPSAGSRRR